MSVCTQALPGCGAVSASERRLPAHLCPCSQSRLPGVFRALPAPGLGPPPRRTSCRDGGGFIPKTGPWGSAPQRGPWVGGDPQAFKEERTQRKQQVDCLSASLGQAEMRPAGPFMVWEAEAGSSGSGRTACPSEPLSVEEPLSLHGSAAGADGSLGSWPAGGPRLPRPCPSTLGRLLTTSAPRDTFPGLLLRKSWWGSRAPCAESTAHEPLPRGLSSGRERRSEIPPQTPS